MENWFLVLFVFIVLLGAITLSYQIYQLVVCDAKSRGLKHPKFWGFFSMGGNNGSGLLLYLLGRNKYESSISDINKANMDLRKKKACVSLCFLLVGTICLMLFAVLNFM